MRQVYSLSPVLFNIFREKIVQKALKPEHPSENDCFADVAVEDAEETDTQLSSVSIGDDHIATSGLLTASVSWARQ